jgi:hypothetical protein
MSQCLNVSCLAACLRERVSRAPAQPGYRTLARAARLGETHPGIRSPVARPKIRIPAPQRPRGVWFFGLRGGKQFAPRAGQCFWLRARGGAASGRCCCCRCCCWGCSGAGSSSGRYGSATAPCSLPARAIPCVWRRGAAQRAPFARAVLPPPALCAAHPHAHDRRAGEEIFWAELRHWTTGGISPPQLCLTVRAECLRGPMSDRLRARAAAPTTTCAHRRRRPLRARHAH